MNRFAVTACVAIGTVGVFAAATSGVRAGGAKASDIFKEKDLVVTLVTPTVNQEVLPDLSDPGLNNVITVRFSSVLNSRDIIDPQNVVNSLSPRVEFLNTFFTRLPGVPSVRRNVFTFNPFLTSPVLGQGQYTLNIKSSIRNQRGRMLNGGGPDFSTTFSVGTDVYPPVLRKIRPIEGQTGIGLNEQVVATFNEPISLGSTINTVAVVDATTNPPTPIPGANGGSGITLARGGFDLVFTPDSCFGYPPKADINMTIQGDNPGRTQVTPNVPPVANAVTDMFQNKFTRDGGLQWVPDAATPLVFHSPNGTYDTVTGVFTLHFQTKGTKPAPVGLRPSNPQDLWQTANPCYTHVGGTFGSPSCVNGGNNLIYTTNNGLGELDLRTALNAFNSLQQPDFAKQMSILPNTPIRLGRPGGVVFDPRVILPQFSPTGVLLNPATAFHTYIYVVNEKTGTVDVVRSDTFKTMGRLAGFQAPRDVGVSTDFNNSKVELYVSNFGSNEVTMVDLANISVTAGAQPGAKSPCTELKDKVNHRVTLKVGSGPTEIAADGFLGTGVMVCNSLEGSITWIDPAKNTVVKSYESGSNPSSVDWIGFGFGGAIRFALIACQGGLNDPFGSVDMFFYGPPGIVGQGYIWQRASVSHDGIEASFTDGVRNPTTVFGNSSWLTGQGISTSNNAQSGPQWFVSNTGGKTVMNFSYTVQGLYAQTLAPLLLNTLEVGPNPGSSIPDPYYGYQQFLFTAVLGSGRVVGQDYQSSNPADGIQVPGVRRLFSCFTH
jgi:hypothetical protein